MLDKCDARPTVTISATEHHCLLVSDKLDCLVTRAQGCEQLAAMSQTGAVRRSG